MDTNDRARSTRSSQRRGGGAANGAGNTIKGPHSALTDYLNEIGVSEHFRNRRREQEEALRQQVREAEAQAAGDENRQATTATTTESAAVAEPSGEAPVIDSADGVLAADMQQLEEEEAQAGPSTRMSTRTRSRASAVAASSEVVAIPAEVVGKGKGKGKRKRMEEDEPDAATGADETNQSSGLNKGSARKGGKMKECEVCSKRFLQRADATDARLLCPKCRRSLDKSAKESSAVSKRARAAVGKPAAKRKRLKKTEGGLLEFDPGLPTLQDLCVRAIAKHIDQVESFGEISSQSANKLCRIISKMRILDENTMGLFLGAEQTSVTLYDCTKITRAGMQRLVAECPNVNSLDLEYCGRLDSQSLLDMGQMLKNLTSVRLDGAFLIEDAVWAEFFRATGDRLQQFKVKYTGFGPPAMRALAIHCTQLRELRVSECVDFDDDCLAMLAIPLTEHEEIAQEAERALLGCGNMAWQPLKHLVSLELGHPHQTMTNQTAIRVVQTVGAQLRVLDLSGFKDIADDFLLQALDTNCGRLHELYLGECVSITAAAFAEFFARQRHKREIPNRQDDGGSSGMEDRQSIKGLTRVGLDRCYMLTDQVIQELVLYSGATLVYLGLNSVDDNLTLNGLLALAGRIYKSDDQASTEISAEPSAEASTAATPNKITSEPVLVEEIAGCVCLEELDLSFVRCASDSVLSVLLSKCKQLSQISVYGCPDVTSLAPARPGLTYIGRESDSI